MQLFTSNKNIYFKAHIIIFQFCIIYISLPLSKLNFNRHQDFIINKLGLVKKLKGHHLAIKTLLFKILGQKSDEHSFEEKLRSNTKNAISNNFYSEIDSSRCHKSIFVYYIIFIRSNSSKEKLIDSISRRYQNKPSTCNGQRLDNKLYVRPIASSHDAKLIKNVRNKAHAHSRSLDITSKRQKGYDKINKLENKQNNLLSPKDVLNSIIDQCSKVDEESNFVFDHEFSNNESMFELGQQMIEKYNPDLIKIACRRNDKI